MPIIIVAHERLGKITDAVEDANNSYAKMADLQNSKLAHISSMSAYVTK